MLHIALLEDDENLAELVRLWLEDQGYRVSHFIHSKALLQAIKSTRFDLLILDWILPDIMGDEVLRTVRKTVDWPIPVIFATSRDAEQDISDMLLLGADDYLTKPYSQALLLARVFAVARRANLLDATDHDVLQVAEIEIDHSSKTVRRHDEEVKLTQKEYELVRYLFCNLGRIVSRKSILEDVWGHKSNLNTRTTDTHISRIRNKLGLVKENGWRISSIYHHGYRLERLAAQGSATRGTH